VALAAFMNARREILRAGDKLIQPDLAATLARVRTGDDLGAPPPRWVKADVIDLAGLRVYATPYAAAGDGATGFVVADAAGGVARCALKTGKRFGAGVMTPQAGYLRASREAQGILNAAIAVDPASQRFRAAFATGGVRAVREADAAMAALVGEHRTPSELAA